MIFLIGAKRNDKSKVLFKEKKLSTTKFFKERSSNILQDFYQYVGKIIGKFDLFHWNENPANDVYVNIISLFQSIKFPLSAGQNFSKWVKRFFDCRG